jgi:quercetin dioxygenase-like cupin family protein
MPGIEIARGKELGAGYSTQGIVRRKAFESENAIISQSQIAPGAISGWHHHGAHHLYGYIVSGRLQLEYILKHREIARLDHGDFFHVQPQLVHRDINRNNDHDVLVVNILIGTGPAVTNVDSPAEGY